MKLHPEGLEPVHAGKNTEFAPWGCRLTSRRDFPSSVIAVMLCFTNSAWLLQEQIVKNLALLDLKKGEGGKKKEQKHSLCPI